MTEHEDDLRAFERSPVGQALRAPATPAELAAESEIVAAYRAAMAPVSTPGSVRRIVGRLGVGGTTVVATLALSSGVAAAAYTNTLPAPMQRAVHAVLPIVAGPVPEHKTIPRAAPSSGASVGSASTGTTTRVPSPPASSPTAAGSPPAILATSRPRANDTPSPSSPASTGAPPASGAPTPAPPPAPPPAPVRRQPAAVSLSASAKRVPVGTPVSVSGVVTAVDGHLLRNRVVILLGHTPGTPGWTKLARGRSDHDGSVTLATGPLAHTTLLRLRAAHHTRSQRARVVAVPTVTATFSGTTVQVGTQGGSPGDRVVLLRMVRGEPHRVAARRLNQSGLVSFTVATPTKHPVRYVVRLVATPQHAWAVTRLVARPT